MKSRIKPSNLGYRFLELETNVEASGKAGWIRQIRIVLSIVLVVMLLGVVGRQDYLQELKDLNDYCNMVKINQETHGQYGWPDFKQIYQAECKGEKYE